MQLTDVSPEHADQFACLRVPEPQRGIVRGGDNACAVRAEENMSHPGRMPAQDGQ